MLIAKTDTVMGGRCPIPTQLGRVRVCATKFGLSKEKKNPMTTLTLEIVEPETITVGEESFNVVGRQFNWWLVHNPELVGAQSESSQAGVLKLCEKLQIEVGDSYDTDLHKEYFLGREFDIVLTSEEDVKRYPAKAGERVGAPILDAEGKPISNGWFITSRPTDVPDNCRPTRVEMPT